jgi:leader peptidase (prepilin peptidase)/N-methyltransferase
VTATDWQLFTPIILPGLFLLGLIFGSFLNVCIYRMPQGLSVVAPRSACPHCKTPIRAYDNIPVISWLVLRGRCRSCKASISPRYAVVELLIACLFLASVLRFGFTLEAVKACVLSFLLVGLVLTDADCHLLPDELTLTGLGIGLALSLLVPVDNFFTSTLPSSLWRSLPSALSWRLASLVDALVGAALGAAFIYGAGFLYLKWKGIEGMGFGDVKLMAMIGSFLGMRLTILVIFAAAMTGSVFGLTLIVAVWRKRLRRRRQRSKEPANISRARAWRSARLLYRQYEIPFGSFLGSVALIMLFYGDSILRWYMSLYGVNY